MNAQAEAPTLSARPDTLRLAWPDGGVDEFASLWLYDNAPAHRDPHSGQRLVDIADLPEQPRIRAAAVQNGRLRIEWENSAESAWFDLAWLAAQRGHKPYRQEFAPRHWLEGSERLIGRDFARAAWDEVRSDRLQRASTTSGAPFTSSTVCSAPSTVTVWKVAMNLYSESKGTSASRG